MNIYGWILCAVFFIGALATIFMVGRPRTPLTPTAAVFTVILNVAFIILIVLGTS